MKTNDNNDHRRDLQGSPLPRRRRRLTSTYRVCLSWTNPPSASAWRTLVRRLRTRTRAADTTPVVPPPCYADIRRPSDPFQPPPAAAHYATSTYNNVCILCCCCCCFIIIIIVYMFVAYSLFIQVRRRYD